MSDLLAPVLCEIKNESETFWCFVGLMQRAIFVCTPTDNDIDRNLVSFLKTFIFLFLLLFYICSSLHPSLYLHKKKTHNIKYLESTLSQQQLQN